ncbi:uncharacterized protein ACN427_007581, partial [Glossina fuscipes fuscipes]
LKIIGKFYLIKVQPIRLLQRKAIFENLNVHFTRSIRGNNLLTINECHAAILLKTGAWLEHSLTFVPNRRGGLNLIYKGYLYTAERRYHSTINWVCNKNSNTSIRCPARCVTADFTIIRKHHHKSYTIINNYRYVISSQSTNTYYLKCANFRKSCRARAIIHRTKFAQYITSRRGTQLVFFKHNTYTPNSKLKPYTRSRDWKCSMYHKAKCKARLVTKFTTIGDIIHETSTFHTHQPMYPDTKPFL